MKNRLGFIAVLAFAAAVGYWDSFKGVEAQTRGIPVHAQYTLTASAAQLGGITWSRPIEGGFPCRKLTVKNSVDAANDVYLGGEIVANTPTNAGVQLAENQAYTWNDVAPNSLWIVGTVNAANIVFIECEY